MTASSDANALADWVAVVVRELGLDAVLGSGSTVDMVLDLTSDVAHGVSRPGAPVTAFLLGVAVGRAADDPTATAGACAERISELAKGWPERA